MEQIIFGDWKILFQIKLCPKVGYLRKILYTNAINLMTHIKKFICVICEEYNFHFGFQLVDFYNTSTRQVDFILKGYGITFILYSPQQFFLCRYF